jgi:thioredoxin-like negative regulator of GroEL
MQELTSTQLQEKIELGENFMLDLYATWCGPCKVMLNNLQRVTDNGMLTESTNKNNYKIYKFDIDSDREFSVNVLNVRSVPTIKMFKEGKEIYSKPGVMSPTEVVGLISNN